jgi:hypothetical protein
MDERIHTYAELVQDDGGVRYRAHVRGRERPDGTWEAWFEFEPVEPRLPTLHSARETTQPNRRDLDYWASGIEPVYLEGAISRAERIAAEEAAPVAGSGRSAPAAGTSVPPSSLSPPARPVLDPFKVFVQGEDILREELSALSTGHLRNILRAYQLAEEHRITDHVSDRVELAAMIVSGVRQRLLERQGGSA